MKKLPLLLSLSLILLVAGCSWWGNKEKETDTTNINFDVAVCDKYFDLFNCVIDNDPDDSYSAEARESIKQALNDKREEWSRLSEETQYETCATELNNYVAIVWEEKLTGIGCPLN